MSKQGYEHLSSADTEGPQAYGFAARLEQAGGSGCQVEEAGEYSGGVEQSRGVEQMAGAPVTGYPVMTSRAPMAMAGPQQMQMAAPAGMGVQNPLGLGRRGRRRAAGRQRRVGLVTTLLGLVKSAVHSSHAHHQSNRPPPPAAGPSYQ